MGKRKRGLTGNDLFPNKKDPNLKEVVSENNEITLETLHDDPFYYLLDKLSFFDISRLARTSHSMKDRIDASRQIIISRLPQPYKKNTHEKLSLGHMLNWGRVTQEFSFKHNSHIFLSSSIKNIIENPEADVWHLYFNHAPVTTNQELSSPSIPADVAEKIQLSIILGNRSLLMTLISGKEFQKQHFNSCALAGLWNLWAFLCESITKNNKDIKNYISQNTLEWAVFSGQITMVDHILHLVQKRNITLAIDRNILCMAARSGQIAMVDYILHLAQQCNISLLIHETTLFGAAVSGQIAMVDYLINLAQEKKHLDQYKIVRTLQEMVKPNACSYISKDIKDHIELNILNSLQSSSHSITLQTP